MSDKARKIVFRITTGLLTVIVLMFAGNSTFNREAFTSRFASLGYPTYLIYPLVIAKILGLVAIWSNKSKMLKEWAYAGFFFNFVLAFLAELHAPDGEYISAPLALVLLMISYYSGQRDKN
ncbi:MAG: DoxX family protein [Bacteroidota bacterium]